MRYTLAAMACLLIGVGSPANALPPSPTTQTYYLNEGPATLTRDRLVQHVYQTPEGVKMRFEQQYSLRPDSREGSMIQNLAGENFFLNKHQLMSNPYMLDRQALPAGPGIYGSTDGNSMRPGYNWGSGPFLAPVGSGIGIGIPLGSGEGGDTHLFTW